MESARLVFRRYREEDLDLFMSLTSDPEVMRYIGQGFTWSKKVSKERLQRFIAMYEDHRDTGLHLAMSKADGCMIGHAGLIRQQVEGADEWEVGYWVKRQYWGRGYGLELAKAWKAHAQTMGVPRLISIIQHANIGSIKVAEKNGMAYERDIRFHDLKVALYAWNQTIATEGKDPAMTGN